MKLWPTCKMNRSKVKTATLLVALSLCIASAVSTTEYMLRSEAAALPPIQIVLQSEEADNMELDTEEGFDTNTSSMQSQEQVSELFNAALKLSKSDAHSEAEALYRKVLTANPNHQMAMINIGIGQKKQNLCASAVQTFSQALKIASGGRKGKIHALIGSCLVEQKQFQSGIEQFERSIEFRPSHGLTWRRLARAMASANRDYTEVVETFDRAIAMDSSDVAIRFAKARYQYQALDFDAAIKGLSQKVLPSLTRKQDIAERYELLAYIYLDKGRYNRAKKYAKKWHKIAKDDPYSEILLAVANKKANKALKLITEKNEKADYVRALTHRLRVSKKAYSGFKALFESEGYANLAKYNLAKMSLRAKRDKNIRMQEALKLSESLAGNQLYIPAIWEVSANLSLRLDKQISARYYAEALVGLNADSKDYRIIDAKVELRYGQIDTAASKLEQMLIDYPKSKDVRRLAASAFDQGGNLEQAIELMQQVTRKSPKLKDLVALARLYQRNGQLSESNDALNLLLETKAGHVEGRYLLAQNLCSLGQIETCHYHAQLVLKLDKNHSGAQDLYESQLKKPGIEGGQRNHG